ncbi:uncharacterized protein RAG0_05396 [Rhynchosporium agropyri]|uniref:Uncharacterized protein n=1 Tax=Rhynchosporium agropyri TaxID=914238 RepID=A0A1E1KCZ7_9HELO|nr:uncharacterized protein RAG0_05396 [Rhynchosporium agropyri]
MAPPFFQEIDHADLRRAVSERQIDQSKIVVSDDMDHGNDEREGWENQKNGDGRPLLQETHTPLLQPQIVSTMTIPGGESDPTTMMVVATVTAAPLVSTRWMTTQVTVTPSIPASSLVTSTVPSNPVLSTMSPATPLPPAPTLPPWASRPDEMPRKGVEEVWESTGANLIMTATGTTTVWTSVVVPQTVKASPSPSVPALSESGQRTAEQQKGSQGGLSESAEHLLIAIGAIGAFVMVVSIIYFVHALRRGAFSSTRRGKFSREGFRGWYGWRKEDAAYRRNESPNYDGQDYSSAEKAMFNQQYIERQNVANYSPRVMPKYGNIASVEAVSNANSQRLEAKPQILVDTSISFVSRSNHTSPVAQTGAGTATQAFYKIKPQNDLLSQATTNAYSDNGSQIVPGSFIADYNNTAKNTQLTPNNSLSQDNLGNFDTNPKAANHMSYMSSLSSGFGDGLIMPEPTVNGGVARQTFRQSRNPGVSRFSWSTTTASTPGRRGDRDTVYTTTSEDSTPRFRTVNSWVAHQADRAEGSEQSRVPSMPPLPTSLLQTSGSSSSHYRKPSEDPAFQHHPGDEIEIGKGARVPSVILDTKTYVN